MSEKEKELSDLLDAKNLEISNLHNQLVDIRLGSHDEKLADHEARVRTIELVAARSNVIFALTTGGGLVSVVMLLRTLLST